MKLSKFLPLALLLLLFACGEDAPETEAREPIANFTFVVASEDPLTVQFTNVSQYADEYDWDFGDGSGTSDLESPAYTYAAAGEYTVTLTATGAGGISNFSQAVSVTSSGEEVAGCFIRQIKETYTNGATIYTSVTTLTYDTNGNIIKIEDVEDGEDSESVEFTYTNGMLVEAKFYEGDELEGVPIFVEYEDNKLAKITYTYEEDGEAYSSGYRFIYSGELVTQIEYWTNEYCNYDETQDEWVCQAGEPFKDNVWVLTYSNGNLVTTVYSDLDEEGNLESMETNEYTYDNKTNPLKGSLAWFLWEWDYEIYFSNNNPTANAWEYTEYDEEGNQEYTHSETDMLDYDYNEDGLPIEINENGEKHEITYECN